MIDAEKIQANFQKFVDTHGKALEVLRKANGKKHYKEIAKELNMNETIVSSILKKAEKLGLAKKEGNRLYKKISGMMGFKPKTPKSHTASKPRDKSFKKTIRSCQDPVEKDAWKNAEIYPYAFVLENSLRNLILTKFSAEVDWWSKKVSKEVQEYATRIQNAEKKHDWLHKRGNQPIYYIGLNELFKIISKNYSTHFKDVFTDQGNLRTWINECVPIRNLLAHNVPVKKDERDNLRIRSKYVCRLIKNNLKP